MQRWIAPALALALSCLAPPAPAQEQFPELLTNGDFGDWDKWPGSWDVFTGAKNGDGALSQLTHAPGGGVLLAGNAETTEWRSLAQQFAAAPETLYRLEFEAKVAGRKLEGRQFKNCYAGLIFFNAQKQRLALRQFDVRSEGWRAGRLTALSPKGTAAASVFLVLTQTGALSFRNVSLKQAANDALGNYDLLVSELDQRYSYFAHKQFDWRARAHHHRVRARAGLSKLGAIKRLLEELQDPHVLIYPEPDAPPLVTSARKLELNIDIATTLARVHQQERFRTEMIRGTLKEGFGYCLVGSLNAAMEFPQAIFFEKLYDKPGIVLDLRGNSGGAEQVAQSILRGMVDKRRVYAKHRTRNGCAADDFTPVTPRVLKPQNLPERMTYRKPVVALIGPGCISSGEAMALMCKALPNVTVIGLPTRGASGNPEPITLANGAVVMASTWIAMDASGKAFEGVGVQPDERVEHGDGDPTLDRAIAILLEKTKKQD